MSTVRLVIFMSHKKLYILDVSSYIFRAYFALPPMSNSAGEPTGALYGFIRSIIKLFKDFSPDHIVAVFDGPDNKKNRREIYAEYKANRIQDNADLPEQMEKAKIFCELLGITHVEIDGVEADDTMGSIALWAEKEGIDVLLCTSDKDLCQLVSKKIHVLNTWKDNLVLDAKKVEEVYGLPPKQIVDLLAIMGDTSDNIPGVKGFGPKTTVPLLQTYGSLENLLEHADEVKGKKSQLLKDEADIARLSKQLATIDTTLKFPHGEQFFVLQNPDVAGLKEFYLTNGFNTLVKELETKFEPEEEEAVNYTLVDDQGGLEKLIQKLQKADEICFDLETTHLRPMVARPVGIGFCIKKAEAYYVPVNGNLGKQALEQLKPLFETKAFFGHNAKYDAHVLANVGIEVKHLSFDTILASYLLNSSNRRHSLDHLSMHYFGKVKTPIKDLIGSGKKQLSMADIPIQKVSDYCCEDVDYTFRLKQILAKELHARKVEKLLFELELPLSLVLMKMERAGVYLEASHLEKLGVKLNASIEKHEKQIYKLAGEHFNINSPKQLATILFEKLGIKPLKKTTTGFSTRAEVLEQLANEYPIAEEILVYRGLEKLRSTYVETLPNEIDPNTKRIHPTFNQFVAATGRLACQDPNLQNIPVRSPEGREIRAAFHPQKKGWSYLAADYSQIELRLLAHLSSDPKLLEAFNAGEDIHAYTAGLMFGVQQVTKEQRRQAKAINFGIIYGQQAYGLSQELGITIHDAAEFIEAYYQRYPKVFEYLKQCVESARKTGKSVTMSGREREIPEIISSNSIARNAAERLAVNTPLQGTAADLIKYAMLNIERHLESMESFLILQVHDELIFEAPDSELPSLQKIVKEEMEGVFSLKVPLVVDINIGKNWAEC